MTYKPILPIAVKAEQLDSDLCSLIYVFNRWLKMLVTYGQPDAATLAEGIALAERVINDDAVAGHVRKKVARCYHIAMKNTTNLKRALPEVLKVMCKAIEDKGVARVERRRADQGMSDRYRPLSRRLAREHIRCIDREICLTDANTDSPRTTRLVRRIVEKRAAQDVHKYDCGRKSRTSNRYRQSLRRAISFGLYSTAFVDYDPRLRASGTHWSKVVDAHSRKRLRAKQSFLNYEEALEACRDYNEKHPENLRPMTAYRCSHCGKWHIGHLRVDGDRLDSDISQAS